MRLLLVLKLKLLVLSRPRRLAFARAKSSKGREKSRGQRGQIDQVKRPKVTKRGIPIEDGDGVMDDHTKTRN